MKKLFTSVRPLFALALMGCLSLSAYAFEVGDTIVIGVDGHYLKGEVSNNYGSITATNSLDSGNDKENTLWVVEAAAEGDTKNFYFYNLGLYKTTNRKWYLSYSTRSGSSTIALSTFGSTNRGYIWQANNNSESSAQICCKRDGETRYIYVKYNYSTWWGGYYDILLTNSQITNSTHIYHFDHEHEGAVYNATDGSLLPVATDGITSAYYWPWESKTKTFTIPYRLKWIEVRYTSTTNASVPINVSDIQVCDDESSNTTTCPYCSGAQIVSYRWATGQLAPASVSVSGRSITITTADKPTSNPLQSRHDTLVVTVEFGGRQYALNVLMEQVTARQVTVDSVAITMSPIYYEFPNADATKLFTVSGKLHQGEITYYSDGTQNSSVQTSDYAIDLTGGGVDIALYDKEFADSWTTSVQNGNQIAVHVPAAAATQVNNPNARLGCIYPYNGKVSRCDADLLQKVYTGSVDFSHQKGVTGRAWDARNMQGTHTVHYTIYATQGATCKLVVPESTFQGYWRWYDYATDHKVTSGLSVSNATENDYGAFAINRQLGSSPATYTMPDATTHYIGLDVSAYKDYTFETSKIVEPTLSFRVIYEIRPAAEMANALSACTGSTYLEEYNMIAGTCNPIYLGAQYHFKSDSDFPNYFVNYNGSVYRANQYRWKRNGTVLSNPNITGNYLKVSETSVGEVVYTLEMRYGNSGTWVNVAKFTVDVQECASVGPVQERSGKAIITDDELAEKYTLLTKLDFDYDRPGTTDYRAYNKPLGWDEATYGFTYADQDNPPFTRLVQKLFPYWGEYMLINSTRDGCPGSTWLAEAYNRSGAQNGYMLYCDGTSMPGVVVSLDLQAQLCAGSRMFCSAWINSAGSGSSPVFQFQLVGIDDSGAEHALTTYTTGEVSDKLGWQQVFFSVESNDDYENYRMRITNHCASASGNDFLIDDIRIYGSSPVVSAVQASTVCDDDSPNITSLSRVDFQSLAGIDWSGAKLYGQWYNETGNRVITSAQYLNRDPDGTCGHIVLPNGDDDIEANHADEIYSSTDDLLAAHATDPDKVIGYVMETHDDGSNHYVLYLAQSIECGADSTITLRMAFNKQGLSVALCAMKHSISIVPRVQLTLDGLPIGDEPEQICGNRKYTLSMRVYKSGSASSTCKADWIHGAPADSTDAANIRDYGYTYAQILAALHDLRTPIYYPTGEQNPNLQINSLDAVAREYLTNDVVDSYAVLSELVKRGLLDLACEEVDLYITHSATDRDLRRTVVPIDGTSPAGYAICDRPIKAVFNLCPLSKYKMSLGRHDEGEKPNDYIRGVRVSDNFKQFILPIDTAQGVLIDTVKLIESTDPDFVSEEATRYILTPNIKDFVGWSSDKSSLTLTVNAKASNFTLKQGYSYTFSMLLTDGFKRDTVVDSITQARCPVGIVYFRTYVVPDTVRWAPQGNSRSWNNDNNWEMVDANGKSLRGGFVPLAHTDVIIPNHGRYGTYPVLNTSTHIPDKQYMSVDSMAQPYISYDFNYATSQCNNIHFEPQAQVENQHMLQYNKAWVEMPIFTQCWQMKSFPVTGVVSGDMYVPLDNYASAKPFSAGNSCGTRHPYDFWQSFFNKSATTKSNTGADVDVTSVTWSTTSNSVSFPYPVGTGGAFWCYKADDLSVDELVVRLPKADTEYDYQGKFPEQIDRPADYGRLGFTPTFGTDTSMTVTISNNSDGNLFVVGNPAMSGFNLKRFFEVNSDLLTGTFYYIPDQKNSDVLSMETCTRYTATQDEYILPPFKAVLVETKAAAKELTVKYTPNMFHLMARTFDQSSSGRPLLAPAQRSTRSLRADDDDLSLLRITAQCGDYYSTLFVGESADASDDFEQGEDAELITFEGDWVETGSSWATFYAKADNRALAVNIMNNLKEVPLAYHLQRSSKKESYFKLWFEGVSSFPYGLQLFDIQTQTAIPLLEGMMLELESAPSDATRYYLQRRGTSPDDSDVVTDIDTQNSDFAVAVYARQGGVAAVVATEPIEKIAVFGAAGQKIYERNDIFQHSTELTLSQGLYLLNITTQSGNNAVRKVVIR